MTAVHVVVLAAGKGTRMKSTRPKALHELLGLPLLEHVLRACAPLAPSQAVTVVVGHQAAEVEAAFEGRGIDWVVQDPPLGTGHALLAARARLAARPEPTALVVNGDLPLLRSQTLAALLAEHARAGAAATLLTARLDDPGPYGRVLRDPAGRVRRIVEARDADATERSVREVNAGVYAFEVAALLPVLDRLTPQNVQGEYYLTDAIALLAESGREVAALAAAESREILGVNNNAERAEAGRLLRERRNAALMEAGVVIEDPVTTFVGLDVTLEAEAVIRPFTVLEGRSRVAAGAVVGPSARLVDAVVERGAVVLDHCLLRECVVEAGASIGPFAHLRPGSVVGEGAKVGNFVELKKTRLGRGSKAPHLSYLGDAEIGPRVNVGAGTITCNYDGVDKHPTRIGEGAFIGSDATLVAPVTVGAGAYVAAGSAITEDVPPDALALGRARQVIKEGWAKRRRELQAKGHR